MAARGDVTGELAARLRESAASRPWAVDLGVALLVQLAVTLPFVVPRPPDVPPAGWAAYGLTTLTVVPLLWRGRAPLRVLLAVLAANTLYELALDGPGQPLPYSGLVLLYTIGAQSPPRHRLVAVLLVAVAIPVSVGLDTRSARELVFSFFVFTAAYASGRLAAARRRDRAADAERAAAGERARIAREMHDVLSHAVSLMIVQAEAGPVAVRAAPERAEAAFDAISRTGRDAMAQLRQLLGVLREDGREPAAPRAPQPGLDAIGALVERVRSGGLDVAYERAGAPARVSQAVGAAAHRIVQEALTNAVKHADARLVRVRLGREEDALTVRVTDDGRGPRAVRGAGWRTGGHGLIGMRERAAALGGTAHCGPGPDGRGFEVRAVLPLADEGVAG
ncbi:histidine kinase [Streptomyces sp. NPDC001941]|uniref:sensor histidine kinase n=1 Tax=Streptomyces sp. NPDC001941 TaxID=3154659 RepID=UPI00332F7569